MIQLSPASLASRVGSQVGLVLGPLAYGSPIGACGDSSESIEALDQRTPLPAFADELAAVDWCAIASLSPFDRLDQYLREARDSRPLVPPIFTVDHLDTVVPARVTPVFKLLGSARRRTAVLSEPDFHLRSATWITGLRSFMDIVKTREILLVGVDSGDPVFRQFLGFLLGNQRTVPAAFVLSQEDVGRAQAALDSLNKPSVPIFSCQSTTRELVRNLAARPTSAATRTPQSSSARAVFDTAQVTLSSLIRNVTDAECGRVNKTEKRRLLRDLFAPTATSWEPFFYDMDFPRSQAEELTEELNRFSQAGRTGVYMVCGPASVGKTTLVKRVAFDLSRSGRTVLWTTHSYAVVQRRSLVEFFKRISAATDGSLIVVVDDPLGLGSLSYQDVLLAAQESASSIVVVPVLRSSEYTTQPNDYFVNPLRLLRKINVDSDFDEDEWEAFPEYLVDIGIYQTADEPRAAIDEVHGSKTPDILSALYILVEETRKPIKDSLKSEYLRIGSEGVIRRVVSGTLDMAGDLLRRAYEYTAVASSFGVSLPIEVLVSALGVSYRSWLDAVSADEGPAWGLLYTEDDDSADMRAETEVLYRTRNRQVTDSILFEMNGGTGSRAGEYKRLLELLAACTPTAPVYREFVTRILCRRQPFNNRQYSFDEVCQLYETANRALPFPDRAVKHHYGLWLKQAKETDRALAELRDALDVPDFPGATKNEAREHIHTSIAATIKDQIEAGEITAREGKDLVMAQLGLARSASFVNPNAAHVLATLIWHLLGRPSDGQNEVTKADKCALVAHAVSDVERMLLTSGGTRRRKGLTTRDVQMLQEVRRNVLQRSMETKLVDEDEARQMWLDHRRQDGFACIALRLANDASNSRRGSDYNRVHDYILSVEKLVVADGASLSTPLREARVQNFYRWQIRRNEYTRLSHPIDWAWFVKELGNLLISSEVSSNPTYRYLFALGLCHHPGRWEEADSIFREFRRSSLPHGVLYERRDAMVTTFGVPRRFQGVVRRGVAGHTIYIEELRADVKLDRSVAGAPDSEVSVYICFEYAGPIAVSSLDSLSDA